MSNPHASTAFDAVDETAPTHNEVRADADHAYEQGHYDSAVTLYERAGQFDGVTDDVRVKMLLRKARSLLQLARFDEMHGALDEGSDIARAEKLIGLSDEIEDLRALHADL